MSKIIPPGTKVRSTTPELAGRLGTIQPEPVWTAGVVYVVWDDGRRGWVRVSDVTAEGNPT